MGCSSSSLLAEVRGWTDLSHPVVTVDSLGLQIVFELWKLIDCWELFSVFGARPSWEDWLIDVHTQFPKDTGKVLPYEMKTKTKKKQLMNYYGHHNTPFSIEWTLDVGVLVLHSFILLNWYIKTEKYLFPHGMLSASITNIIYTTGL